MQDDGQTEAHETADVIPQAKELGTQTCPDYLGPYPVCFGESAQNYEQLRLGLVEFFAPSDPLENIYVRDMADADWQLQRVNRAKANCLSAIQTKAVHHVLLNIGCRTATLPIHDKELAEELGEETQIWDADEIAYYYAHQAEWARTVVAEALQKVGLTEDVFIAQAMSLRAAELERMDRSALWHQAARDQAMTNLARHRANKAAIRKSAPPIEDAEYRVIEGNSNQTSQDSSQQRKLAA